MKIAVLSDVHFTDASPAPERKGEIANVLLLRAVHRLNRMIKPDVTLILGDLIDDPHSPKAAEQLIRLQETIALLQMPAVVIPGNHDPRDEVFYQYIHKPHQHVDIGGIRFLWFIDPDEPEYNARRTQEDLQRMRQAADFDGPVIALQHVPVLPPGKTSSPYNHVNADEIIEEMRRTGIKLSISGHYHAGIDHVESEGLHFVSCPALSESPFSFLEVDFDGKRVVVRRHNLQIPPELGLIDCHAHTQFAYCGEDVEIGRTLMLSDELGLAGVRFTEHSGQLYFDEETYWKSDFMEIGCDYEHGRHNRVEEYLQKTHEAGLSRDCVGFECDCALTPTGGVILRPEDAARAGIILGGVHVLSTLRHGIRDYDAVCDEFMLRVRQILQAEIDVLAHPFRIFLRNKLAVPRELFGPVTKLLKQAGTAAEINFHTNQPPAEFIALCIEHGVKLSLGSDSHNQYEVAEFGPHLALLEEVGFSGNLHDILWSASSAE